jgi:hypothetical protein
MVCSFETNPPGRGGLPGGLSLGASGGPKLRCINYLGRYPFQSPEPDQSGGDDAYDIGFLTLDLRQRAERFINCGDCLENSVSL